MKNTIPIMVLISTLLISCAAQKPLNREEALKLRQEQIAATTRIYEGVSKENVLMATDRLFRLADESDFQITHTENAVIGQRRWLIYLVLAATMGNDNWIVAAEQNEKDTKVVVRVNTTMQSVLPMPTAGASENWAVSTMPGVEQSLPGKAIYTLFFKRLDYLLGMEPEWMDCEKASAYMEANKIEGLIEALCNSFNIDDKKPL